MSEFVLRTKLDPHYCVKCITVSENKVPQRRHHRPPFAPRRSFVYNPFFQKVINPARFFENWSQEMPPIHEIGKDWPPMTFISIAKML